MVKITRICPNCQNTFIQFGKRVKTFCSKSCASTYTQLKRGIPIEQRFWSNVKKLGPNDCWEWQAGRDWAGYGVLHDKKKQTNTHRYSYRLHKGEIPKGMVVCHSCDNPPCVNPNHLWLGTYKENIQDCIKKKRFRGGRTKLTLETAQQIRSLYATNNFTQKELGKMFGTCQTNITRIVHNISWIT